MPRSQVNFKCGETPFQFAESYRYLGCELDEYLDFTHRSRVLAEASGRSLGSVVNKHKLCGEMYYELYKKLYDTCVTSVMDYCGVVWGFKDYDKCNTIQNQAIRAYLGVHRFSSNIAIQGDLAWITSNSLTH